MDDAVFQAREDRRQSASVSEKRQTGHAEDAARSLMRRQRGTSYRRWFEERGPSRRKNPLGSRTGVMTVTPFGTPPSLL